MSVDERFSNAANKWKRSLLHVSLYGDLKFRGKEGMTINSHTKISSTSIVETNNLLRKKRRKNQQQHQTNSIRHPLSTFHSVCITVESKVVKLEINLRVKKERILVSLALDILLPEAK